MEYCRTRVKDFNNLNVLEFNITYFNNTYKDEATLLAALLNFPPAIQKGWRDWKNKKLADPWIRVPASAGGVVFCFAEDQTPLLITAIPELLKLKDAVKREEKRDDNELYKGLEYLPLDAQQPVEIL